ncbi:hypothetical protein CEUSTIGMA_g11677.t1 [Chlamydomonas eustigma]|uniref:Uncharacterized protein n=1 Tax=Chlamydomonas eustigma TaxID=1157962 RepID=A0A250XMD6_9CHLO|nr:hypothetical protein CEUSTIGMA_g11677.t1 [Chlamydomonas eustigma]|eukprot:GAX84254.1 hypothetical protein CEUSTIGMA_g11677.t1 [Chlamydomonas eustigma]
MVTIPSSIALAVLLACICLSFSYSEAPTYADLALALTPLQFTFAITQMRYVDDETQPDGVKSLRMNLLYAREAIDIFAYAYPRQNVIEAKRKLLGYNDDKPDTRLLIKRGNLIDLKQATSSVATNLENTDDLLLVIRRDLDEGYEVLGDFQDLAHSLVHYEVSDVELLRSKCLVWQQHFVQNMEARGYNNFLQSPSKNHLYDRPHKDLSRLFWGFRDTHPDPHLSGYANMALLLTSLAEEAGGDVLTEFLLLPQVYNEPQHSQFHMYRKLIRSLLAVVHFFPDIIIPDSIARMKTLEMTLSLSQEDLHHKRSSLKFSVPTMLLEWEQSLRLKISHIFGSLRGGILAAFGRSHHHSNSQNNVYQHDDDDDCGEAADASSVMEVLQTAFHDMGQVNNIVFAYNFYLGHGLEEEAEQQRLLVIEEWGKVSSWLKQQDVPSLLACFTKTLKTQWDL